MVALNELFDAVATAETGGETNPFIRTRVQPKDGSTAYGPVQITGTLAKDFLDRRDELFSKEEKNYLRRFLKQADKFNKFGGNPDKKGFDPRFDYGGEGELTSEEDKNLYNEVAKKMLGFIHTKNNQDLEATLKEWRFGANSKKGRDADPEYFSRVEESIPSGVVEGEVLTAPLVDIEGEVIASIQRQLAEQNVAQTAPESISEGTTEVAQYNEQEERVIQDMMNELQGLPTATEVEYNEQEERVIEQMMLDIQHNGLAAKEPEPELDEFDLINRIYG